MKPLMRQVILLSTLILSNGCSSSDNQNTATDSLTNIAQTTTGLTTQSNPVDIVVYKSPTCGCCAKWEEHLDQFGFNVISKPTQQLVQIKNQHQIPTNLRSCHTAMIDGYIIEGHVPASDIKKLLKQRPEIVGLTAPGMPQKSPGMQAVGEKPADYDVFSFDEQGKTEVFSSY